tara:strand:+ start:2201 stop:3715 length:1515 start_codon:yes stop_codon:yes gene_type:complete
MKRLYIVDLSKNYKDIKINNSDVIYINRGNIDISNCKVLNLKKLNTTQDVRKIFINEIEKKINYKNNSFFKEFEVFNLRNDKNFFISKIIIFLKIKNFLKNKKYNISCVSDNNFTHKIVRQISKTKTKNEFHGKIDYDLFRKKNFYLYYFKFLVKTFFLLIFIKIFSQNKIINKSKFNKKKWSLSLYPNFYKDKKEIFFENKFNKINFLLSDETHLNHSLLKILNIYFKNKNQIINIESFVKFNDIFLSIRGIFKKKKIFDIFFNKNLLIDNLNFTEFYKEALINSFINRSKLTIYDQAIKRFQSCYNIQEFHMYLFEYNFGFYLIRKFKKNNCKIVGYQHGIFDKNIMWLDLVKLNSFKIFVPNTIISNYKLSLKYYKNIYKNKVTSYKHVKRKISNLAKQINIKKVKNKNRKTLIISGTHDIKDIYYYCKNRSIKNKNNIFYIKVHPKNKFNFKNNPIIKKIDNINGIYFNEVLVSSTSTIAYDLKALNKKFSIFHSDYKSI